MKIKLPYGGYMTPKQIKTAIAICKVNKIPITKQSILSAHLSF